MEYVNDPNNPASPCFVKFAEDNSFGVWNMQFHYMPARDFSKVSNTKLPPIPSYKAMFQGQPKTLTNGAFDLVNPPH